MPFSLLQNGPQFTPNRTKPSRFENPTTSGSSLSLSLPCTLSLFVSGLCEKNAKHIIASRNSLDARSGVSAIIVVMRAVCGWIGRVCISSAICQLLVQWNCERRTEV